MWIISGIAMQVAIALITIGVSWRAGVKLGQIRLLKDEMDPPPPVNVRLHMQDGEDLAVDTRLSPVRTWLVIIPEHVDRSRVIGISADELRGFNTLEIRAER